MTYQELWHSLTPLYEPGEAQAIVRMLLDERFGLSLADVVCGGAEQLSEDDLRPLMSRLQQGEPIQYVLGRAMFCGHTFGVAPGVLIPRPETEELCQWIAADAHRGGGILDVGTGSGCIAITLALACRQAHVTAVDISADALAIARQNASQLGATVDFRQLDILHSASLLEGPFSVIVSNPPYICHKERESMHENVLRHEPEGALFVPDDDPLLFYRAIAHAGRRLLSPGGELFFEINPLYHDALVTLLSDEGYSETESRRDAFGKTRFIKSTFKPNE
ncbi:MAG: peptide chain release factor N(5)-glutamine methyltransferase [Prevotella sp.]|nr:peptide chain release factor N(5)-glutamine methyltransferase [Prevotella sp.]